MKLLIIENDLIKNDFINRNLCGSYKYHNENSIAESESASFRRKKINGGVIGPKVSFLNVIRALNYFTNSIMPNMHLQWIC